MLNEYLDRDKFALLDADLREQVKSEIDGFYACEKQILLSRKKVINEVLEELKAEEQIEVVEEKIMDAKIRISNIHFDIKEIELREYGRDNITDYEFSTLSKRTQKELNRAAKLMPEFDMPTNKIRADLMLCIDDVCAFLKDNEEAQEAVNRLYYMRKQYLRSYY